MKLPTVYSLEGISPQWTLDIGFSIIHNAFRRFDDGFNLNTGLPPRISLRSMKKLSVEVNVHFEKPTFTALKPQDIAGDGRLRRR